MKILFLNILTSLIFLIPLSPLDAQVKTDGIHLSISDESSTPVFSPLQTITVLSDCKGNIEVLDGHGDVYLSKEIDKKVDFQIGGAIGMQQIILKDNKGRLLDRLTYKVDCQTEIDDKSGTFSDLLNTLYWTMVSHDSYSYLTEVQINNQFYKFFVCWLRDHVHTMKGMKYFSPDLKSAIDLYADFQRDDGMIFDNIYKSTPEKNWWEKRFSYGDFYKKIENGQFEFKRIPVENDVEYLFIEGLYNTWKATGDTGWMASLLDNALKAVNYSTNDIYRWSDKYQLLKRGYTIDTWDFQTTEDAAISDNDIMVVYPDKTRFGVMFGDNTGMSMSCSYLAEMLAYTGRMEEAEKMSELGKILQKRIDDLAWNGKYYIHHIPEDPTIKRDLGVDEKSQVSLSNAYSLNRNLTHEQCVAIINTYQRIRDEMPVTSPGEWYTIYPPFERGFGRLDTSNKWEYMNGGVTSIVAGELAHGAFEHGYEYYGADILRRIGELAAKTDDFLHCAYRGAMPEEPERNFMPVSLKEVANVNYPTREAKRDGNWLGHGAVDRKKTFHEIPFEILDPEESSNTAIEISLLDEKKSQISIDINRKASSIYFLHTRENGQIAGTVTLIYEDGSEHINHITQDKVGFWWYEFDNNYCKTAWRSNNEGYYIGFSVYGMNNPFPEKTIQSIHLRGNETVSHWRIAGITLCDTPVFFMPSIVSHGIPDNWGAGAVVYALLEGLAGIKDTGVAFDKALLAPRWEAAGENEAKVTVRYASSGGYVSYLYKKDPDKLNLTFTGTSENTDVQILLPEENELAGVLINGQETAHSIRLIEKSRYVCIPVSGKGVFTIELKFN